MTSDLSGSEDHQLSVVSPGLFSSASLSFGAASLVLWICGSERRERLQRVHGVTVFVFQIKISLLVLIMICIPGKHLPFVDISHAGDVDQAGAQALVWSGSITACL